MRLFRKRKSVAPGQGDAKARETLAASARSPSPAAAAGAPPPPPQAEEQANLADTPAGAFEKLDGVSRDDVVFSSVPWAAAAATTEERPGSSGQPRVEDEAAAAAAQPPTFGRRHSQAKKDRFRLFRSRSTYFRRGPDDGSSKGGGGGEGGVASHKPRLSWPTPRGTTPTTTTRSSAEPQAREQRQRSSRGQPGFESVEEGVSAGAAEEDGPVQQQSPPPRQRSEETRQNSVIGAPATSDDPSSSSSWRLQSLKRLPSLSLKRRLSRSHRLKPPSVVVTPASVVSLLFSSLFFLLFRLDGTFRGETESEMGGEGGNRRKGGGPLPAVLTPVHQIRPHIYPRFISPSARRAMARALMGHDPSPATNWRPSPWPRQSSCHLTFVDIA